MFAVVKTGGKQYRVAENDIITVEKLVGEPGTVLTLDQVLMAGGKVGRPLLAGASVSAEIVEQTRGPKLIVFKKRRRKSSRRKNGHRQDLTTIKITGIKA
ncbi:MAG: 50S ribosomal protein L21 [Alphaproteobacteria bacterium]|nr:50S ribosomal protein L21 [Alphaproteobacteria bacterium]